MSFDLVFYFSLDFSITNSLPGEYKGNKKYPPPHPPFSFSACVRVYEKFANVTLTYRPKWRRDRATEGSTIRAHSSYPSHYRRPFGARAKITFIHWQWPRYHSILAHPTNSQFVRFAKNIFLFHLFIPRHRHRVSVWRGLFFALLAYSPGDEMDRWRRRKGYGEKWGTEKNNWIAPAPHTVCCEMCV